MASQLILFFLATFGLSLGLFFSIILLRKQKRPPYSNQILGLLLLFLSLRIGKSVFYNFVDLPTFVKNLGLACNLAVGPLLLLYGFSLRSDTFSITKKHFLHFLPSLLFAFGCTVIPNDTDSIGWAAAYSLVLLQSFVYAAWSARLGYRSLPGNTTWSDWYIKLTIGLTAMWTVYLLIFLELIPVYIAGAFSFTVLMAIMAFLAMSSGMQLQPTSRGKYEASTLDKHSSAGIVKQLNQLLSQEPLYLDGKVSLRSLAERIATNPKALSQAINENTGQNFSAYINGFRVAFAKKLLNDPDWMEEKMISIAYESGFTSLSSFNTVFKQHTQCTPTEFRERSRKRASSLSGT